MRQGTPVSFSNWIDVRWRSRGAHHGVLEARARGRPLARCSCVCRMRSRCGGRAVVRATAMGDTSRLLGLAGMYCPADSSTAFPCPVGTVAASIGGDSLASCIPCGPGTYSDLLGATSGTACVFCPVGTASRVAGASSLRNCSTCGPGTYGPSTGLASCTPCPAGTHQPNSGATTLEECLRCRSEQVAGLVQPTVDTSTSDTVALAQLVSGIGGLALVFVLAIVLGLSPGHLVKKLDVLCGTLHIPDDKHAMTFYRKSTPRGAVHRLRS